MSSVLSCMRCGVEAEILIDSLCQFCYISIPMDCGAECEPPFDLDLVLDKGDEYND